MAAELIVLKIILADQLNRFCLIMKFHIPLSGNLTLQEYK
jgi:hypothetical protein